MIIKRTTVFSLALLCFSVSATAQKATVTGTVIDPHGTLYASGSISAELFPPGGPSPTVNNQQINGATGNYPMGDAISAPGGFFSMNIYRNDVISPAGTQWVFTICNPGATPPVGFNAICFKSNPITITGDVDISAPLNALAPILLNIFGGGGGPGTGTVTSVGLSGPGGVFSVANSPITTAGTIALTAAGTTGGLTYFSNDTTISSSALITACLLIKSGGTGQPVGSTICDNGVDPPRSPNGLNVAGAGLWREAQNANPGTTVTHLACLSAPGSTLVTICADNVTSGVAGIAGAGAGNAGTVQLCMLINCSVTFDNQSVPGDFAIPGTGGRLHDTGSVLPTASNENFYVYTANAGADTAANVAPPGDLVGGGGGGAPGSCANPMLQLGDIIVGGVAGACTRLAGSTTLDAVVKFYTSLSTAGVAGQVTERPGGIDARAVTGTTATDTLGIADRTRRVDYQGSVSVAVSIDSPTNLGGSGYVVKAVNSTTGVNTGVTVTAGGGSNIKNGQVTGAALTIPQGMNCTFYTDANGTTWDADCSLILVAAGLRVCTIDNDTQSATPLTDAQISGRCQVPGTATLVEVDTWASSGTPSALLERFRPNGATVADLLSGALPTGAAGIFSCATATISQTCIDGITSSGSITLSNTVLNAGDVIRVKSATAGGVATWDFLTAFFRVF